MEKLSYFILIEISGIFLSFYSLLYYFVFKFFFIKEKKLWELKKFKIELILNVYIMNYKLLK